MQSISQHWWSFDMLFGLLLLRILIINNLFFPHRSLHLIAVPRSMRQWTFGWGFYRRLTNDRRSFLWLNNFLNRRMHNTLILFFQRSCRLAWLDRNLTIGVLSPISISRTEHLWGLRVWLLAQFWGLGFGLLNDLCGLLFGLALSLALLLGLSAGDFFGVWVKRRWLLYLKVWHDFGGVLGQLL